MKKPRPGGRTARNRMAVFKAAAALILVRDPHSLTMTEIAERAGVAATSLYRRWRHVDTLLLEVAVDELNREHPLPDTGSLDGDLRAWARKIATGLRSRKGSALFKVIVASAAQSGTNSSERMRTMEPRLRQIDQMLRRATERGEIAPSVAHVIDYLFAPLYIRALFGKPGDNACADNLADDLVKRHRPNGCDLDIPHM